MKVLNPEKFVTTMNQLEMQESIIGIFSYKNIDGVSAAVGKDNYDFDFRGYHFKDFILDITLTVTHRLCVIDVEYECKVPAKCFKRKTNIGFNDRPTLGKDIIAIIYELLADIDPEHRNTLGAIGLMLFTMDYIQTGDERPMMLKPYIFNIEGIANVILDSLEESEEY